MSVNFQSDDWDFVKAELDKSLAKQRSMLEQAETWREFLEARAKIQVIKTFLALPESVKLFPAQ